MLEIFFLYFINAQKNIPNKRYSMHNPLAESHTIHNYTELTRYIRICSNIPENLFHCHRALRHCLHLRLLLFLKSDGMKFILAINLGSQKNTNIENMIHT